ncbi:hypothetical protein F2P81_017045 [Scophthalmus maximus]|uniref:Uncharacterized protein n=1 Tax=Scophthalmus maximus TaxID=52904 RepID=A0A6A4SHB9_SCOMX|nr:hypothetical protein F2P81_017045 [Scophthalmus maximus]
MALRLKKAGWKCRQYFVFEADNGNNLTMRLMPPGAENTVTSQRLHIKFEGTFTGLRLCSSNSLSSVSERQQGAASPAPANFTRHFRVSRHRNYAA